MCAGPNKTPNASKRLKKRKQQSTSPSSMSVSPAAGPSQVQNSTTPRRNEVRGNNVYGNKGKPRCADCRHAKAGCHYPADDPNAPCSRCRKRGLRCVRIMPTEYRRGRLMSSEGLSPASASEKWHAHGPIFEKVLEMFDPKEHGDVIQTIKSEIEEYELRLGLPSTLPLMPYLRDSEAHKLTSQPSFRHEDLNLAGAVDASGGLTVDPTLNFYNGANEPIVSSSTPQSGISYAGASYSQPPNPAFQNLSGPGAPDEGHLSTDRRPYPYASQKHGRRRDTK